MKTFDNGGTMVNFSVATNAWAPAGQPERKLKNLNVNPASRSTDTLHLNSDNLASGRRQLA